MATATLNYYISVFDTESEQQAYDQWASEQLAESARDKSPGMPHDEFMAKIEAIIVEAQRVEQAKLAEAK